MKAATRSERAVAEAPGDRLGLVEQRIHSRAGLDRLELVGEPREHLHALRRVGGAEPRERPLEQPDPLLVPQRKGNPGAEEARGLRQRRRVAEPVGELRRLAQERAPEIGPALVDARQAPREQDPAALVEVGRRQAVERGEGVGEVRARRLAGRDLERAEAGPRGVVRGLRRIAGRVEVARELGEPVARRRAVERLERLAHAAVETRARVGRQLGLDGLADERVGEAIGGPAGDLAHDVGAPGLVERLGQPRLGDAAHGGEALARELAAQRGGEGERLAARFRETTQPRAGHVGDGGRHGRPRLLRRRLDQLADEEGVAVGPREERVEARLVRLRAGEVGDEGAHVRAPEPAERDARARCRPRELGQRLRDRVLAVHLGVAQRRNGQDARAGELAGHVDEQRQRRGIGPLQVVEHQHEAAVFRRVAQRAREIVEEPEARLARPRRPRRPPAPRASRRGGARRARGARPRPRPRSAAAAARASRPGRRRSPDTRRSGCARRARRPSGPAPRRSVSSRCRPRP